MVAVALQRDKARWAQQANVQGLDAWRTTSKCTLGMADAVWSSARSVRTAQHPHSLALILFTWNMSMRCTTHEYSAQHCND
jgi:hypothetical protein